MNREEIIARAQDYIAHETDPFFSDEVKALLQKRTGKSSRIVSTGTWSSAREGFAASSVGGSIA